MSSFGYTSSHWHGHIKGGLNLVHSAALPAWLLRQHPCNRNKMYIQARAFSISKILILAVRFNTCTS